MKKQKEFFEKVRSVKVFDSVEGKKVIDDEYKPNQEIDVELNFKDGVKTVASFIYPTFRKQLNLSQFVSKEINYDIVPDLIWEMIIINDENLENKTVDDLTKEDFKEIVNLARLIGFPYDEVKGR